MIFVILLIFEILVILLILKLSFSEKATKICNILKMVLTVSKPQNQKEDGGWMAFSEKLNFTDIKWLILTI